MKKTTPTIIAIFFTLMLISCGGNQSKNESTAGDELKSIDACTWLTKTDAEAILGTPVGECKSLVNSVSEDGRNAVSQVAYYSETDGSKYVSLMVKRMSVNANPSSKMEYAEDEKSADVMDAGNEVYEAIKNGEDISGLGDLAFTYEMIGHNLMVFWKGNHMLTLTVNGTEGNQVLPFQKSIASKVVQDL